MLGELSCMVSSSCDFVQKIGPKLGFEELHVKVYVACDWSTLLDSLFAVIG